MKNTGRYEILGQLEDGNWWVCGAADSARAACDEIDVAIALGDTRRWAVRELGQPMREYGKGQAV